MGKMVQEGWRNTLLGMFFYVHRQAQLFLSVYVDDITNGWVGRQLSSYVVKIEEKD